MQQLPSSERLWLHNNQITEIVAYTDIALQQRVVLA
jgi:hypothetical protein